MKKHLFGYFLLVAILFFSGFSFAQKPNFYKDIEHFKQIDSQSFPPKNAILFIGSSSFTKWKDVQSYFPNYTIINRGFGGSTLPDVIRYANDIIYPYQPRQVVIYCGDNDFAASDTVTAATVVYRVKTLFGMIRTLLPNTAIDYISIKLSPSRKKMWDKIIEANKEIQAFLQSQNNAGYIDIVTPMQKGNEQVDESLFLNDMLHMKPAGYAIWQKAIVPFLKKD